MSEQFDPYLKWLGIFPKDQPPNFYRLLGIDLFVDDPDVIENAAHRQMSHVRTFGIGEHSALSQKLLNEIATAKVTLLVPAKKEVYDRELRSQLSPRREVQSPSSQKLPRTVPPQRTAQPQTQPARNPQVRAVPVQGESIRPVPISATDRAAVAVDTATAKRNAAAGKTRAQNLMPVYALGALAALGLVAVIWMFSSGEDETPGPTIARTDGSQPTGGPTPDQTTTGTSNTGTATTSNPPNMFGSTGTLNSSTSNSSSTSNPPTVSPSSSGTSSTNNSNTADNSNNTATSNPASGNSTDVNSTPPIITPANTSSGTPGELSRVMSNYLGMKLVAFPAGEFLMGSADDDPSGFDDERPQHKVTISRPFYLSAYEVTRKQFAEVMGRNLDTSSADFAPQTDVNWDEANEFCRRLSGTEGALYRLPTEAEWEYALRRSMSASDRARPLGEVAWFADNSGGDVHPVGQLQPNAYGMYDMLGNVEEWCEDLFDGSYYQESPDTDPVRRNRPGDSINSRILRGGKWSSNPAQCRIAFRGAATQSVRSDRIGFRVVRVIPLNTVVAGIDEDPALEPEEPADKFWPELGPLLAERNYDAAEQQVKDWLADPANEADEEQLRSEQADIARLKRFQAAVENGLRLLKPGAKIRVRGIGNMEFVGYNPVAKVVSSRIGGIGSVKETGLNELRPDEWHSLAETALNVSDDGELTWALFQAVDKSGDPAEAQSLLLKVAATGVPVERYLGRLEGQLDEDAALDLQETRDNSQEAITRRQALREKHAPDAVKIGDHYYKVCLGEYAWPQAAGICLNMGGYLARCETREEQDAVSALRARNMPVWVGGYQLRSGNFIWAGTTTEIPRDRFYEVRPKHRFVAFCNDRSAFNTRHIDGSLRPATVERIRGFVCEWDN